MDGDGSSLQVLLMQNLLSTSVQGSTDVDDIALFRAPLSLRYLSAAISAERCTAKAIFINCFCSLAIAVWGMR